MAAAAASVALAESYDHHFHVHIAQITRHSALSGAMEGLWEARVASPQKKSFSLKVVLAGVGPKTK